MFGGIDLLCILVTLTSVIALITDLLWGKIFNWLNVSVFLAGLALAFANRSWAGLADSALGAGAGLLLFGWMYWLRFIGGGDVKFLMALGALGGLKFTWEVTLLSLILGGIFAAMHLVFRGRWRAFYAKLRRLTISIWVSAATQGEAPLDVPDLDRNLTMPFGIPMAVAAVWTCFAHPLIRLGVV
jgi:prepilin peptidase CpaA